MRKAKTFRFDEEVLELAQTTAARENRSLTNYIETVLRKELGLLDQQHDMTVIAPEDVRTFDLVKEENESDEHYAARRELIGVLLERGGY